MTVAVCIVGFRNAGEIAACLAALARSEFPNFEVVICENGGAEAFADLQARLPGVLPGGQKVECLLAPGNLGYAGGVNFAMRARPRASAWWILNPDTQPEPGALAALVERVGRGDVHAAGGVLLKPDGRVQALGGRWRGWLARPVSIGMGTRRDALPWRGAVERATDYILGASMLVTPAFVQRAGFMREDYFLYGEEVEWCLRARRKGVKLGFAPDAVVRHGQGGTTGSGEAVRSRPKLPIYMDERNKLHVVRDTTPWRWPVAVFAALALLVARYAGRAAWPQLGHAMAGWWAGVTGQRGIPAWLR